MAVAETDEAEFAALKSEIAEWVAGPGERWAEKIEETGEVPAELFDELKGNGWLSLAAPVELGGRGIPFSRYLELLEIISKSHGSIRMLVHVINGTWRAMAPYASRELIEEVVKPSVAGDKLVAFTLTEPDNGTGADIQTTVRSEGDEYVMNGVKHLITFGVKADYLLIAARLEGTKGNDGTVAFAMPNRLPGAVVIDDSDTMGVRGTDHAILEFHDTRVPAKYRLGEEGQGLEVALGGFLLPSRVSVAMSAVGLAERAQELAIAYANERETFGKKLAERQAIQFYLAENYAHIAAAKALIIQAARAYENDAPDASALSSAAKMVAVEMLAQVTDNALQVHGGRGYWKKHPIERVYRDARAQRFEEGTNEIQKLVVARAALTGLASTEGSLTW
ncbi:acyl-CoA dehydrogenase family protein [Gryllotalpicola ginsengisoli]|uniref:acyl-CoA dehydrogenase family protein n=1 Tax=Gryllotalpicola ginsengisoli TaxID=444608 RepID=UPI0003B57DDE|nr:acyl-CoA dehydrogenase [Gryllotalpicola ginsengisoli]